MKITIVSGFFLPIPAVSGGATEKTWDWLSRIFAREGHDVTILSRAWPNLPVGSEDPRIRYLRLPGFTHSALLGVNLLKDIWWSWRVFRSLPSSDIVIVNSVALPIWLRRFKPRAGKLVIMTGRVPKGQYRFYHDVALTLAASSPILALAARENPQLASVGKVYGYPVDYPTLSQARHSSSRHSIEPVHVGFISRLNREKGLEQFVDALLILAENPSLPPWTVTICGPASVPEGGSGTSFVDAQFTRLRTVLPAERIHMLPPEYDAAKLAKIYQSLDIYVLPSLAEYGETFGVANIEAMAAGATVVTSRLACFGDYLQHEENGLSYDHRATDATQQLADCLTRLLQNPDFRKRLAAAGRNTARHYDYELFAQRLLADFSRISQL